jgi:hypothetical protein
MTGTWPCLLAGLTLLMSAGGALLVAPNASEHRFRAGAHTAIVWEG